MIYLCRRSDSAKLSRCAGRPRSSALEVTPNDELHIYAQSSNHLMRDRPVDGGQSGDGASLPFGVVCFLLTH